jgi:iron complex transport system substrate-binding protein
MFVRPAPLIVALVALGALTAFVVVSCGGDSGGKPSSPASATATPASPPPGPTSPPQATPTAAPFPLTVTSSDGSTVVLERAPERIVAFDSAAVEILFAIGHGHRVAGTHSFVEYPPEVRDVPKVGDAFNVNFEAIAALKPDLVYIFFDRFVPDLQKLGVPVVYLETPATFAEVASQMRLWGRIVGAPEAGDAIARRFEDVRADFAGRVADVATAPGVYVDISPMLWTLGSGSLTSEMLDLLRAKNVFSDVDGARQVSGEEIVARAPAVIVSTYPGGTDQFKTDPVFATVPAVANRRLCEIDGSLVSAPGPRLVEGIGEMARCVYPDRFR